MNGYQLTVVKEYGFDKTDVHEIEYFLDDIFKDFSK